MRAKAETKGFVMITVALVLVILLAFGALAIDVGMFYASRTAAQTRGRFSGFGGSLHLRSRVDRASAEHRSEPCPERGAEQQDHVELNSRRGCLHSS